MAWDQLWLYIGEATVATIFGVIVGPHCLDWFSPTTWGNTDNITLELSRIVLVVQIFAVAVELPKKYMLKHWLSVFLLLLPVMTFGWLISSVFIWKLVPTLSWVEALVIAACVTATDPVLASAVVGKGKFARRVPGHLRNLLSAETSFSFHKQDNSNTNVLTTTENNENAGAVYPATSKVAKPAGGMPRRRKNKRKHRRSSDEPHVPQNIPIDLNAGRRAEREKVEEDERAAVAALHAGEPLPVVIKKENGDHIQAVLPSLKLKQVKSDDANGIQAYQEGSKMIIEDSDGEVIDTVDTNVKPESPNALTRLPSLTKKSLDNFDSRPPQEHKRGPRSILEPVSGGRRVVAYRLDDDIIIENLEGEVIRRYRVANKPATSEDESNFVPKPLARSQSFLTASLNRTLSLVGLKKNDSTHASSSKGDTSFVPVLTSSKPSEHIDDDRLQKQLHKLFNDDKSGGSSSAKANPSTADASASSAAVSSGAEKTGSKPATTASQAVGAGKKSSTGLNLRSASPVPHKASIISSSNDEYTDSESESESESDIDEDEETEIEKQRRLDALKHQEDEDNREYLAARARALADAEKAIEKSASKH
ncbi:hypothetical protein DV451_000531 [Geotrichum candidum]|uniref:Alkali metal cation/H+ antiporter Nha1 C-terminal domain-containing protein n=1 Tax=Geotrichum candidum TaxID=1173061 RepID=A0A9P5G9J7_GEOCN|nr:hypothetical protein DV451_000531 [Geotrichum candidum]KAF5111423.1 hypothetical protein DV453_000068 [Geotrichum candidum]